MPRERPGLVQETHTDAGPPARPLLTSAFPACSTAISCSRKPWSTSPSRSSSSLSSSLLSSSLSESLAPLPSPSSELLSCGWAACHASPPPTACPPTPCPSLASTSASPSGCCSESSVTTTLSSSSWLSSGFSTCRDSQAADASVALAPSPASDPWALSTAFPDHGRLVSAKGPHFREEDGAQERKPLPSSASLRDPISPWQTQGQGAPQESLKEAPDHPAGYSQDGVAMRQP